VGTSEIREDAACGISHHNEVHPLSRNLPLQLDGKVK